MIEQNYFAPGGASSKRQVNFVFPQLNALKRKEEFEKNQLTLGNTQGQGGNEEPAHAPHATVTFTDSIVSKANYIEELGFRETIKVLQGPIHFIQSVIVEKLVSTKNAHRAFFLRGIYPFYLLAVTAICLFYYFALENNAEDLFRTNFFTFCLVFKTLFASVIPFTVGKQCEVVREFEDHLLQNRPDLSRFFFRESRSIQVFRSGKCNQCRRLTMKYEKHSFLFLVDIGASNVPLYFLWLTFESLFLSTFLVALAR